jgi:hypothetical protein
MAALRDSLAAESTFVVPLERSRLGVQGATEDLNPGNFFETAQAVYRMTRHSGERGVR